MNQEYRRLMAAVRNGIQKQRRLGIYLDKPKYATVEEMICALGKPVVVYPALHSITKRHGLPKSPGRCLSVLGIAHQNERYRYVEGVCALYSIYREHHNTHNGGYQYIRHAWLYDTWHRRHIDPSVLDNLPRKYFGIIMSKDEISDLVTMWSKAWDDPATQSLHERCGHYPQYGNHELGWTPLTYFLVTRYWRN